MCIIFMFINKLKYNVVNNFIFIISHCIMDDLYVYRFIRGFNDYQIEIEVRVITDKF
jgi:hypothetical protein